MILIQCFRQIWKTNTNVHKILEEMSQLQNQVQSRLSSGMTLLVSALFCNKRGQKKHVNLGA